MSKIIRPDGSCREVKNLGWLLRHSDAVLGFTVSPILNDTENELAVLLRATLDHSAPGGYVLFETQFASPSLLWRWLHRPRFQLLSVVWGRWGCYKLASTHCRQTRCMASHHP